MMHVPPCFRFSPLFQKNFRTFWKIFKILPFPEKFLHFHPQKFLMTFFSHRPQIFEFPPIFAVSVHFPPVSRKLFFTPYFSKCPPCFRQIHLLFYILYVHIFHPTLTMMHLCITQCTYWTPLLMSNVRLPKNKLGPLYDYFTTANQQFFQYKCTIFQLKSEAQTLQKSSNPDSLYPSLQTRFTHLLIMKAPMALRQKLRPTALTTQSHLRSIAHGPSIAPLPKSARAILIHLVFATEKACPWKAHLT